MCFNLTSHKKFHGICGSLEILWHRRCPSLHDSQSQIIAKTYQTCYIVNLP